MKILITGANGRLGSRLMALLSHPSSGAQHDVRGCDLDTVDITKRDAVCDLVQAFAPALVIHCAALTAVDYCAEHPDEALEANAFGTQNVALACQALGAALLYISTNEVFSGHSSREYLEYDRPEPGNPYGYSKWVGEQIVRDLVRQHYIVRTAWLFAHGGHNFIQAILDRAASGQPLRVVTNEVSSPTYTDDLAQALIQLIETRQYGIYHLVNAGSASRYAFARLVLDLAGYQDVPLQPIALSEYVRASRPPEYTPLRNMAGARLGIVLRPWQAAVKAFLHAEARLKGPAADV